MNQPIRELPGLIAEDPDLATRRRPGITRRGKVAGIMKNKFGIKNKILLVLVLVLVVTTVLDALLASYFTNRQNKDYAFTTLDRALTAWQNDLETLALLRRSAAKAAVNDPVVLNQLAELVALESSLDDATAHRDFTEMARTLGYLKSVSISRLEIALQAGGFSSIAVYTGGRLSHYLSRSELGMMVRWQQGDRVWVTTPVTTEREPDIQSWPTWGKGQPAPDLPLTMPEIQRTTVTFDLSVPTRTLIKVAVPVQGTFEDVATKVETLSTQRRISDVAVAGETTPRRNDPTPAQRTVSFAVVVFNTAVERLVLELVARRTGMLPTLFSADGQHQQQLADTTPFPGELVAEASRSSMATASNLVRRITTTKNGSFYVALRRWQFEDCPALVLGLASSRDSALRNVRQTVAAILVVSALVLVLCVWTGAYMVGHLIDPIVALTQAAKEVRTRGDYAQRVPASGTDEVGRLGQNFNAMMEAIHQREVDLRRISLFQRTILENAASGIISTAPDGVVTSFNPAAERLLGYKAEEVVGTQTPMLWHDPDEVAQRVRQLSAELGEMVTPGFGVLVARACRNLSDESQWTFLRKNGTRVPVYLSVTALRDEHGQVTGFVGLAYDLTERKRAEDALRKFNEDLERRVKERTTDLQVKSDELRESQRALIDIVEDLNEKTMALEAANNKLEAVNKELEAFSYSVSHDLRAPLRGIDGFSQALQEDYGGKLDDEGRHYLQRIRSGARRMAQLIDDMLSLSRVTRGELRMERVNLSSVAQEIADELARREPQRKASVTIAPDATVTGDARFLRVALENLLGNAWKFTARRPEAMIEFGVTQQEGGPVFFVRDNGAGFDMNYASRLFGTFQRLHTSDEFPGTGVGLATVQRILHRHGGHVWAEGKVDQGATIYFTLPNINGG